MESPSTSHGTNKVVASFYRPSTATIERPSEALRDSPVIAMLSEARYSIPKTLTNYRILSTPSLLAVAWMLCAGTPDRNDVLVERSGPLPAFCGLILFTVFYSIPFSCVVAELCTAFPDDGGVAVWVKNAFGPFWGFQAGLWVWISMICSCATPPSVFFGRITDVFGSVESQVWATIVKVVIAMFMAVPSFFGTRVVGRLSLYLMVMVLTPFVVLSVIGYACSRSWGDLGAVRRVYSTTLDDGTMSFSGATDVDPLYILKYLFYCFDGIVLVSVFGGEVAKPSTTYRMAIFLKLAFHFGSFLIPLSSAVVYARPAWYHFGHGAFKEMATSISPELANLIQISSDISALGSFVACMFAQTYLLCGMARSSMVPRQISRRNERFGTPNLATFCGVAMALVCVVFLKSPLLDRISSAFSALSQLIMIAAIVRLRFVLPQGSPHQPKVLGNSVILGVVMVIPVSILCFMVYTAFAVYQTTVICSIITTVGLLLGGFLQLYGQQQLAPVLGAAELPNDFQDPVLQS